MKKFYFLLLLFLLTPVVFGQLAMELYANQMTYMRYEPIYVKLRIRNDSGRPIVFGESKKLTAKVFFEIQDINGKKMELYPPKAVTLTRGKVIQPGQISDIIFTFSNIFKMKQNGVYRIHAYITHSQLPNAYRSNNVKITISDGIVLGKAIEVGMPETFKSKDGIDDNLSRFFSIRTLNDGASKFYYCRLEDTNKVYQVARLAPVLGTEPPVKEVDMAGTLHLLLFIAPKIYKYQQFLISGELAGQSKYYKAGKHTPTLVRNSNGKVFVVGGEAAIPNVDFLINKNQFRLRSAND